MHATAVLSPAEAWDALETSRADIPGWLRLARAARGPVLELGCGAGRVTWALARAGLDVTGVDLDPGRLQRARARTPRGARPPAWVEADARALALDRRFALVLLPARFLELVGDRAAQLAVLRGAHAHLDRGGRVALHLAPPPHAEQPALSCSVVARDAWRWGCWSEVLWQERLLPGAREVTLVRRSWRRARLQALAASAPLRLTWILPDALEGLLQEAGLAPRGTAPEPDGSWVVVAEGGAPCP